MPVTARADADFCCPEHKSAHHNEERREREATAKRLNPASAPEIVPIAEIRAEQEAAKSHWSMVVREGIIEALRSGRFHADDLEPLGIPDEHRNIIGSQTAKLVNQKWMAECGRRKSTIPSRNGAKSNVYRLTEHGRRCIAGGGADTARRSSRDRGAGNESPVSVSSGESGPVQSGSGEGVPTPRGPGGANIGVPCCTSTAPPDSSTGDLDQARGRSAEGEPVEEVSGAAQLFDLDDARPEPSSSSAFTNPEAA